MTTPLCEAFYLVAELCIKRGEHPINQYPDCWECQIDEHWRIAVNGHAEPRRTSFSNVLVPPFTCYAEWNGWPALVMNPYGGQCVAGELANETTFIEAVRSAMSGEQEKQNAG